MLASAISTMDRSSIGSYHARIFEQCLLALDLRRQHPVSVTDIDMVEQSVIHTIIVLTMKLTETLFRPLFIRCLEWAESGLDESELSNRNLDRPISFFKLVSKLAEQHRSVKFCIDLSVSICGHDFCYDITDAWHMKKIIFLSENLQS